MIHTPGLNIPYTIKSNIQYQNFLSFINFLLDVSITYGTFKHLKYAQDKLNQRAIWACRPNLIFMGLCFYTCKVQLQTIHPRTFLFRTESSEETGRIHPAGGHGALRARHCRRPRRQVRLQVRNWGTHECIGCGDTGQVFSPILTLEFCSFFLEISFFFYHLIPFSSLNKEKILR